MRKPYGQQAPASATPTPTTIHLLVESHMEPIPATLAVIEFDAHLRGVDETSGAPRATGRHVAVTGDEAAIKQWLRPFRGVWVGLGTPALQHFTVMHIS